MTDDFFSHGLHMLSLITLKILKIYLRLFIIVKPTVFTVHSSIVALIRDVKLTPQLGNMANIQIKNKCHFCFPPSVLKPVGECGEGEGVEMQKTRSTCWEHAPIDGWRFMLRPLDSETLVDSSAMAAMTACVIPPMTTFIYEIRCNMVTGFTSCHACAHTQKQELF